MVGIIIGVKVMDLFNFFKRRINGCLGLKHTMVLSTLLHFHTSLGIAE